jgi:hypothetical protein
VVVVAVGRAPELECATGLHALAFEPHAGPVDLGLDQRRLLDKPADSLGRLDNIIASDSGPIC